MEKGHLRSILPADLTLLLFLEIGRQKSVHMQDNLPYGGQFAPYLSWFFDMMFLLSWFCLIFSSAPIAKAPLSAHKRGVNRKLGMFVQAVHSILAQNPFLEAPGNFSMDVPSRPTFSWQGDYRMSPLKIGLSWQLFKREINFVDIPPMEVKNGFYGAGHRPEVPAGDEICTAILFSRNRRKDRRSGFSPNNLFACPFPGARAEFLEGPPATAFDPWLHASAPRIKGTI